MSSTISQEAFDLIVAEEVSSEAYYSKHYRAPEWPGGASGATIGIGYDVGYATRQQLHDDWGGVIPDAMIQTLESRALGIKGEAARATARELRGSIDVPWEAAIKVHQEKVLPRWVATVEKALPNCDQISPDCLGALVSLAYNRGASFSAGGDRYIEMRAIKAHMTAKDFAAIPAEFQAMKRLWPNVAGLRGRRDREAALFKRGLSVTAPDVEVPHGRSFQETEAASVDKVEPVVKTDEPVKPLMKSTTLWSVIGTFGAAVWTAVATFVEAHPLYTFGGLFVVVLFGMWIARERVKRFIEDNT